MLCLFIDNLKSNPRGDDEDEEEIDDEKDLRLMGVDEAIIYSIEKCGRQCSILCHLFSYLLHQLNINFSYVLYEFKPILHLD